MIQAALEGMRARRTGTIVNLSSIAAKDPSPVCSMYAASKGALEALSESLAQEVAPFGISVLIVEPGAFRTNFLAAMTLPAAALPDDYRGTPGETARAAFEAKNGKQVGDPQKGVDRIFEALTGEGLAGHLRGRVLRLMLGQDALLRMKKTNDKYLADIALGEEVARSTDY